MSGGSLLRGGGTLTLNNASSITGGTVLLSSQSGSRINTTGLLTLGTASMNYTANSGSSSNNALVLGGDIAVNPSTTFNFIDSGGNTGNPRINLNNATRVFEVGSGANLNVGWDVWSSTASAGGITKNGTGTLTLSGANTYTGATLVNAGTLLVNGSLVAGNSFTVANGATLGGSGTINGPATVDGGLRPGNSPGVLSFGASLSLTSTSQTFMELNGSTRGTGYDGINVTGALTYGGALTIDVGSAFLGSNGTFSLFTFGSQSGNFTSVDLSGAYGSGSFTNASGVWSVVDSSGNQWAFSQLDGNLAFTAVPEPSTIALAFLGLALAFIAIRGRRPSNG